MKIVVAVKQVPERDAPVRVSADGRSVDSGDTAWTMNEPDAYALEEALQLKERGEGEVIVLSAGPERVESTLREALAKGADRALHIVTPESGPASLAARDILGVAQLLAEAIRSESPDLVLTGLQSDDLGAGQTGVVLAELLGLAHATLVLSVETAASGDAKRIRVKRELEDGWFQHIEMPLPALLTIQSGGNRLRYATLMGIKRARSKETRNIESPPAAERHDEIVRVSLPQRTRQTEILTGPANEIAAKLAERLRAEVGL
jgi:electron transfer flavoprotein beta subunit